MPDLHKGLLAVLDPDNGKYLTRSPRMHVRQNVRNGRCADAHGVEMEAQQKNDGTMWVTLSRIDWTGERIHVISLEVPPPGVDWRPSNDD